MFEEARHPMQLALLYLGITAILIYLNPLPEYNKAKLKKKEKEKDGHEQVLVTVAPPLLPPSRLAHLFHSSTSLSRLTSSRPSLSSAWQVWQHP
jgi:hypothetical protein